MEGHNTHGYIQEDHLNLNGYDDLMSNAGWPAQVEQQYPSFTHSTSTSQNPYTQYSTNSSSFDHFDIPQQQQVYPPVTYSNSPYASQYQQTRAPDVFSSAAFNVDPSLQNPAYHQAHENSFAFAPQAIENRTISPQSLQYPLVQQQQQPVNRGFPNSAFQRPSSGMGNNVSQGPQDQSNTFFNNSPKSSNPRSNQSGNSQLHLNNNLVQFSSSNAVNYPTLPDNIQQNTAPPATHKQVEDTTPPSHPTQSKIEPPTSLLRITHPELLPKDGEAPRIKHAPYLAFDDKPVEIALNMKRDIPKYHPRKSRSGRELVSGFKMPTSNTHMDVSSKRDRSHKRQKLQSSTDKSAIQGPRPTGGVKGLDQQEIGRTSRSPTESSSPSSSSDESDSDDEMPVMNISEVRGSTRPTDPAGITRWDAIGIVWKDPYSSPSDSVIKEEVQNYAKLVLKIRADIRTVSADILAASSDPAKEQKLKDQRVVLLRSFYQAIDAANQLGFPDILKYLGTHEKLVAALTSMLFVECRKDKDYNGELPTAILTLLSKFQTVSDALLGRVKFEHVQKYWKRNGGDETKKLVTAILDNTIDAKAKETTKAKKTEQSEKEKTIKERSESAKARSSESTTLTSGSSSKRPHDGDGSNGKPNKKFASDVAGLPASTLSTAKPVTTVKRPTGNLLGISSKPVVKPVKKREPSPPTESKLGAILASIAKPAELPKAPAAPPRPPETPEEKARRERKESRRHLRVKFKDGPELEEIRLFKHEQAEDEGRQDEMLRDAHEHQAEGMMHKNRVKGISEPLEDDDYEPSEAVIPYQEPVGIDFSKSDKATHFGPTYVTRGGELAIDTAEQKTQQRREAVELMVIYTDLNDIPPSPKEPPHTDGTINSSSTNHLKHPSESWFGQRISEINTYGPEQANRIFSSRLPEGQWGQGTNKSSPHSSYSQSPAQPASVSSVLQQLAGTLQPNPTPSNFAAMEAAAFANLERIVNSLKGKPYPAVEPPDWMTNPAQRADWIAGYERDKAAKQKAEAEEAARLNAANLQAQAMAHQYSQHVAAPQASYPVVPAPYALSNPAVQNATPDVNSLLAAYQSGQQPGQVQAANLAQYDYSAWAAQLAASQSGLQGQNYQAQQPRWDALWGNENVKPASERSRDRNNAKGGQRSHESKKPYDPSPFDENGEYKGKKKPCRFYSEGKCVKGDKCTYLHDD